MVDIAIALQNHTARKSGFEKERGYVSLSHISKPVDDIVKMYLQGFEDSLKIRLRCYKGYQMERDLKQRIVDCFGKQINTDVEIKMMCGRIIIAGHPDFTFDGYPGDCKSVPLDEHLPAPGNLPRKVYWQLQGYMRYMDREKALAIYESRETGIIRTYWINANKHTQAEIEFKLEMVVQKITAELEMKGGTNG